uniref:Glycosyltransferase n=1 Tax=Pueraria montana var. lobata TaxID=3893 RepID=A0A172J2D9_PUEML|nr:UDP-glycosyltransferase 48 [Pueraria montana var. lobata]
MTNDKLATQIIASLNTSKISMAEEQHKKLHIAVFPWLAFGHLGPFFELAKLIAQKDHKVSFISTPRNIHRLSNVPENSQPLVDLIELPLPHVDKLPENAEATVDIPHHIVPYLKKAYDGLEEPLTKFLERCKPDWIVHDFAPHWLPPICSKLGISCIFFGIFSASGQSFILDLLMRKTSESPEDKALLDVLAEQDESGVSDMFRIIQTLNGAQVLAPRSCMEIEGESLKLLEGICRKPVIPVGLLPPSQQFSEDSNDGNWDTILNWLDKQEKGSVIYVAFGSEVTLSDEEFTEIAMGLELSDFPFFWVLKKQNTSAVQSQDWVVNESKRGMVWRTWAPQLRILAHKSVGGFLTHCGWSSVIEGLQVGCPLIMLPFQNEQYLIARLMEEKGVGIKVAKNEHDGKFTRDSVAQALRSVMLEEEGRTYRSQAEEMSKIFGDKKLHQNYVDEFVNYMEIHRPAIKD